MDLLSHLFSLFFSHFFTFQHRGGGGSGVVTSFLFTFPFLPSNFLEFIYISHFCRLPLRHSKPHITFFLKILSNIFTSFFPLTCLLSVHSLHVRQHPCPPLLQAYLSSSKETGRPSALFPSHSPPLLLPSPSFPSPSPSLSSLSF